MNYNRSKFVNCTESAHLHPVIQMRETVSNVWNSLRIKYIQICNLTENAFTVIIMQEKGTYGDDGQLDFYFCTVDVLQFILGISAQNNRPALCQ